MSLSMPGQYYSKASSSMGASDPLVCIMEGTEQCCVKACGNRPCTIRSSIIR